MNISQRVAIMTMMPLPLLISWGAVGVTPATGPLRVHPTNPRYFTDGSGKVVYLTGSHTWRNVQDSANVPDFTSYLDFLQKYGHNFTRLWVYRGSPGGPALTPTIYARTGPVAALSVGMILVVAGVQNTEAAQAAVADQGGSGVTQVEFFVSPQGNDTWSGRLRDPGAADGPFATLERARDAVRALHRTQRPQVPVRVTIRGGTYFLDRPVEFGPQDSGTERAPVVYGAAAGEQVVLSGGRRIENGHWDELNGMKLWAADVPEVKAGMWRFRQLFANGRRQFRTRLPKQGEYQIEALLDVPISNETWDRPVRRFVYAGTDIQHWHNLGDVEVVAPCHWVDNRLPIQEVDPGKRLRYNVIHDVKARAYGGWGIYPDEGSSEIVIESNLVYRCSSSPFFAHINRKITVQNNIFALGGQCQVERAGAAPGPEQEYAFLRNLVYYRQGKAVGYWDAQNHNFAYEGNLYWNASGAPIMFGEKTFAEWQATGQDKDSLIADPLFMDPEHGDFRLRPDSPAARIGFQPWDLSVVGPRPFPVVEKEVNHDGKKLRPASPDYEDADITAVIRAAKTAL